MSVTPKPRGGGGGVGGRWDEDDGRFFGVRNFRFRDIFG